MQNQKTIFKRKQLAVAVSMAILTGAITGCSSSSSDPAPTPPGTATISTNGGNAGDTFPGAMGGYGGEISLYNEGGFGGIEARTTGAANTDFTTPITPAAPDLGDNPLEVIANLILQVVDMNSNTGYADGTGSFIAGDLYAGDDDIIRASAVDGPAVFANDATLASGSYYLRSWEPNSRRIYMAADGVFTAHSIITGISVAEGATLTLGNNNGCDTNVDVNNDIDNNGTITKVIDSEDCQIWLGADTYIGSGGIVNAGSEDFENGGNVYIRAATGISNSGSINTAGFDEDDEPGGQGGRIDLRAGGYVINSGALNAGGGDGGNGAGGNGENVYMNAAYVENNGAIDTSGGDNVSDPLVAGNGGQGYQVSLYSTFVTNNTGGIDTSGGDGTNGGQGGYIYMDNDLEGEVKNAGDLNMSGGAGLDGNGGQSGSLSMSVDSGNLLNSGDIAAMGGDAMAADFNGGNGGEISFWGYGGETDQAAAGDIVTSGSLNANGGSSTATGSGDGGDGGYIRARLYLSDTNTDQRIALLGYASISADGGDGAEAGSGAGVNNPPVEFYADHRYNNLTDKVDAGSVVNDVPISATGGDGKTDTTTPDSNWGGRGGEVNFYGSTSQDVSPLNVMATNNGAVDISGGDASADSTGDNGEQGGDGGEFSIASYAAATNTGNVDASGGDGGEQGGDGGEFMDIFSVSALGSNTGNFDASGGDGAEFGGQGGELGVIGASANNSGDINANGGNATGDDPLVNTFGGWGGEIVIFGTAGLDAPATNTGNVTYSFGTGDTNGEDGCLQVGLTFTGNCN